jgi:phospholipid transport system substrate-binding protein
MRWTAVLLFLTVLTGGAALSEAASATPTDTVRRFYDALLTTMKNGQTLGPKGRFTTLEPVVGRTFDIPYMTRVATGPAWAKLSQGQRDELTRAFGRYITATYAERFDRYAGQKLDVTGEQRRASDVMVDSRIVRADGTPVIIRYLMRQDGETWQVGDVYLSGTISELATRRSEFSAILEREGVEALIARLNRNAATMTAQ